MIILIMYWQWMKYNDIINIIIMILMMIIM